MMRLEKFIKGLQMIQQVDPEADTISDDNRIWIRSLKEELSTPEGWGKDFEYEIDEYGFNWENGWRFWT